MKKVKAFQMAIGCDLIGSKMSMAASKTLDLKLVPEGVEAVSKTTGRIILIPFPNIKGIEMMPEVKEAEEPKKQKAAKAV